MSAMNQLERLIEEFFEGISPAEMDKSTSLRAEVEGLFNFLADEAQVAGDENEIDVIEETLAGLTNIWKLISRTEKTANQGLKKRYDELREHLECMIDERSPESAEAESWADEYLVGNENDDFYGELDDESDEDGEDLFDEDEC